MMSSIRKRNRETVSEHASFAFEDNVILGTNIERLRTEQNYDIAKFAQVSGVGRPTIYEIERGEGDPKLSTIRKIANALDVGIIELFAPLKGE